MIWRFAILLFGLFFMRTEVPSGFHSNFNIQSLSTDSLIASYYLNGNALDEEGDYNGAVKGAEITVDRYSSTQSAFRFDGVNEYLNLGGDFTESIDSLSISLWIYPFTSCVPGDTAVIDSTLDQYFLSSGGPGESTGVYGVWNMGSLMIGQSLSDKHTSHEYHTFLDDSMWHHITMVFDVMDEEASIYINGTSSFTMDYVPEISSTEIDSLFIGNANFEEGNGFWGKIDDIKFFNRILSPEDIELLYKENCPDSLHFENLLIQSDTLLYAQSAISFDTLQLDSACNLDLVTPYSSVFDSSYIKPISSMTIKNMDGCNHNFSIYNEHFEHRGVYINNFVTDGILGNPLNEDTLLNWCIQEDFNNLYLYNIGTALSSGMEIELDSFVQKANDLAIDVTFVSAGFGTSFDNIVLFHENYSNIPQGIVSEIEFWNGSGNYDEDYVPWLDRLDSLKFVPPPGDSMSMNPTVSRRFYIGKIKNPGQPPSITIAEDLLSHHDEIFLTNYHSNAYNLSTSPSENSIRNKLSLLATAAKNLGTEVNIVILFNVRQDSPAPNIWSYYSEGDAGHDFRAGYEKFYHDFLNVTDIDHKEFINLKGYGVYRYTDAIEARSLVD